MMLGTLVGLVLGIGILGMALVWPRDDLSRLLAAVLIVWAYVAKMREWAATDGPGVWGYTVWALILYALLALSVRGVRWVLAPLALNPDCRFAAERREKT